MAAAATVKPVKLGLGQSEAFVKQKKHKDTLDTSLLCSKLEEFKREQDAHRLRKEKRNAVRNGYYVPRSAATQFTATATPMDSNPVKRRSYGQHLQPIHEPQHTAETLRRGSLTTAQNDSQKEDASEEQEKRDSMFTGEDKDKAKEDHPVRKSKPMPRGHRPIAVIIPERRSSSMQQESSPDSIVKVVVETEKEEEELEERGRSRYTPGDAAKRRQSMIEIFPQGRNNTAFPIPDTHTTEPPHRPISFYAIQDLRAARSILDNEVHDDETSRNNSVTQHQHKPKHHPEDTSRNNSVTQQRPKLALDDPHNRPNWSQNSESGDGMRHHTALNFLRRPVTEGGQRAKDKPARQGSDHALPRRQGSIPSEGHLIADAVKIIQRQERLKKRQSVMGFFKRL